MYSLPQRTISDRVTPGKPHSSPTLLAMLHTAVSVWEATIAVKRFPLGTQSLGRCSNLYWMFCDCR